MKKQGILNAELLCELTKLRAAFVNQKSAEVSMDEFVEMSKEVKLFIRTGELRPASNILLVSATGVRERNEVLDVCFR